MLMTMGHNVVLSDGTTKFEGIGECLTKALTAEALPRLTRRARVPFEVCPGARRRQVPVWGAIAVIGIDECLYKALTAWRFVSM